MNFLGTSSSYVPPLPPTLSVSQIFSYTSASSNSQPSSCISTPSQPQDSSCISASNYISTFTLPPPVPVPTPPFPFCLPAPIPSHPQDSSSSTSSSSSASGSGQSQNSSLVARLPQWSSYFPATTMPITNYITTPSGRHHFYSQVSWPYPYPPIPHRALHRLPSTESFKMPTLHPYIPYPSSAAPYYPRTTIPYPVYYNTNYRPNMQ